MSDISDQIRKTTSWETMEDYNKECEKRKVRARKFGTEYVAPKLEDFLPWTEVKRIRDAEKRGQDSTPTGFATGIDLTDAEEISKQEARKARFTQQQSEDNPANDGNANVEGGADESKPAGKVPKPDLPVAQCWDKEEMLIGMRNDPPSKFWITPTKEAITPEEKKDNDEEKKEVATWVPEKIHLSSIDWAAFKQIRNKDLMAYFTGYGPTYVEWLGDNSCNVCFEDQFTAKRALMTLGQEIPSPPPSDVANYVDTESKGDSQSTARNLPDLGNMTWRFCRKPIRKVVNDKYGRKGTIARVLMRCALTTDILQERPNEWPAPPGGFSSTKVLGPNSDYKGGNKKKTNKKKRKSQQPNGTYIPLTETDSEHPMLGRGLSSGRDGFSKEELEQERATKRSKTAEE